MEQIPHIRTDDERKYVHASTLFRIKVGGQVVFGPTETWTWFRYENVSPKHTLKCIDDSGENPVL